MASPLIIRCTTQCCTELHCTALYLHYSEYTIRDTLCDTLRNRPTPRQPTPRHPPPSECPSLTQLALTIGVPGNGQNSKQLNGVHRNSREQLKCAIGTGPGVHQLEVFTQLPVVAVDNMKRDRLAPKARHKCNDAPPSQAAQVQTEGQKLSFVWRWRDLSVTVSPRRRDIDGWFCPPLAGGAGADGGAETLLCAAQRRAGLCAGQAGCQAAWLAPRRLHGRGSQPARGGDQVLVKQINKVSHWHRRTRKMK
eukprot:9503872-Pyramimonas_sp.AAC.1